MRAPTSSERLRLEKYRERLISKKIYGSVGQGNNGVFVIPVGPESESYRAQYQCIVSDEEGWEHVSVVVVSYTGYERTPTWAEMCAVKDLFWRPDEWVVQFHPARADYVNVHAYCLHLWKPTHDNLPQPPRSMVA